MKKHHKNCNWEKADCSYKKTHHYCPHPEHACNCKDLRYTDDEIRQMVKDKLKKDKLKHNN